MGDVEKKQYREVSEREATIPLSARGWWLDAVCGPDGWDVALTENSGEVLAALPFVMQKKLGFTMLRMPRFGSSLGVWLKYPPGQKYESKLNFEKKMIREIIHKLPPFDRFYQRFDPSFTNWLPFFWEGFSQTTRYTYVLPDLTDEAELFKGFRQNIRREIRKAEKQLSIETPDDTGSLYPLIVKSYQHQGKATGFSQAYFQQMDDVFRSRSCRKILLAVDGDGHIHAGAYIVWDQQTAYYLIGGSDPAFRSSGAGSYVLWAAIRSAAQTVSRFDFEGSMIEPIERFFRSFGALQVPYFAISKNKHLFKLVDALRKNH